LSGAKASQEISMQHRVLDTVYVGSSANVYSQPIDLQGLSALAIAAVGVAGTVATNFFLEGSNDLETWAATGITLPFASTAAAPSSTSGVSLNIPYRYVRVKVTGGASAIIVRVNCGAFEAN